MNTNTSTEKEPAPFGGRWLKKGDPITTRTISYSRSGGYYYPVDQLGQRVEQDSSRCSGYFEVTPTCPPVPRFNPIIVGAANIIADSYSGGVPSTHLTHAVDTLAAEVPRRYEESIQETALRVLHNEYVWRRYREMQFTAKRLSWILHARGKFGKVDQHTSGVVLCEEDIEKAYLDIIGEQPLPPCGGIDA